MPKMYSKSTFCGLENITKKRFNFGEKNFFSCECSTVQIYEVVYY